MPHSPRLLVALTGAMLSWCCMAEDAAPQPAPAPAPAVEPQPAIVAPPPAVEAPKPGAPAGHAHLYQQPLHRAHLPAALSALRGPDFRGHGQSSRIATGLSTDMIVDDMIALLRALGLERPFIVGHSMGADIAGRLAATYPARAVVLVDPALRNFAAALSINPDAPPPWMVPIIEAMRALRTQPHAERMLTGLRLLPPKW